MKSVFILVNLLATSFAFFFPYSREVDTTVEKNLSPKLLITPYIESGKIEEVRALSKVKFLMQTYSSYSGFVTVNKKCDANLFFWFFLAETNYTNAPVSVWLQGGPGASSLYGLFLENGPFYLPPSNQPRLAKYPWTKMSSYLYIDNPVGTGYSYAGSEECYSRNSKEIGENLLIAVKQVLKMFPELKSNPFYITGESYAGKYVPALAYAILKDKDPESKVNLQGIAIGNGLVDPVNQLIYSDYLYQLGMVDANGRNYIKKQEQFCREYIADQKWMEAFRCFDDLLNGDTSQWPTYFQNVTGFDYYFNYLFSKPPMEGNLTYFITQNSIREMIHVGNATWHNGTLVEKHLMEDVMKSVRPWLEELLENYRVLIYNGQLDIIVAYPLTEGYLQKLNWSGTNTYKTAKRHIWKVDKQVAGYVKTAGNLAEVLVRNAGHMVPHDQPKWASDLIQRFLNNEPFF